MNSKSKYFYAFFAVFILGITVVNAQPVINSFSPSNGAVGSILTISGTNLNNPTALVIGGQPAVIISNSPKTLTAMVMPGAVSGSVSVTTANGTTTSVSLFNVTATKYPIVQLGNKLVGSGYIGSSPFQGQSCAISADGNTAIVGGIQDNNGIGAAWIFIKRNGNWIQQGNKLVGNDFAGESLQGNSVGISADGNTVIIGGKSDNNGRGAAWIFIRNAGVWTQQGNKLASNNVFMYGAGSSVALSADGNTAAIEIGNDINGFEEICFFTRNAGLWTQQGPNIAGTGNAANYNGSGGAVAISADGNTAIMGNHGDSSDVGTAWIFTRKQGVWSQQGPKLVGSNYIGSSAQGFSVAISADGNTAMIGGPADNNEIGAAWVFTRNNGVWTQQGNKLVGAGYAYVNPNQGISVCLSADGNTAMIGGYFDNDPVVGAVWVFTRNASNWTQQGTKLIGTGYVGGPAQGTSVSITADGSTAIEGGYSDNAGVGATWIFTASAITITYLSIKASCNQSNGSITVKATNGSAPYSYSIDGISFQSDSTFTGLSSGNYTLIVKDASGSTNTASAVVYNRCPLVTAIATDDSCNNGKGVILVSGNNGTSPYQFSIDGIHYSSDTLFNRLHAGLYHIIVKDNIGLSDTISLNVNNYCLLISTQLINETCGFKNGNININATGGVQPYQYSIDGVHFQNSVSFAGLSAGIYSIMVKDSNNVVTESIDTIINIVGPAIDTTILTPASCYNKNGSIEVISKGGTAPFQFSIDTVHYQSSNLFTGDSAGVYTVSVKDNNGCYAYSTVQLIKYPVPFINLGNDTAICSGQTLTINAGNNFAGYLWNNGSTSSFLIVDSPGIYTMQATDIHACTVTDSIIVFIHSTPVFSLGKDTSLCQKQTLDLQTTVSGTYLWQDGSTLNHLTIYNPGLYWLEVNNNNCIFRDSVNISYRPLPKIQFPTDTTLCGQASLLLNASQANNFATYKWQDGSTRPVLMINSPGEYQVTVTMNGCAISDTIIVNYLDAPVQKATLDTSKCKGESIEIEVTLSDANYLWQDSNTSPLYTIHTSGIYYCSISNFCGIVTDTIKVTDNICECFPVIPNAFSPNGDGINDEFIPIINCTPSYYHLQIFDREGQLIFESYNMSNNWKGTFNNKPVPVATYYYVFSVKGISDPVLRHRSGSITLLR